MSAAAETAPVDVEAERAKVETQRAEMLAAQDKFIAVSTAGFDELVAELRALVLGERPGANIDQHFRKLSEESAKLHNLVQQRLNLPHRWEREDTATSKPAVTLRKTEEGSALQRLRGAGAIGGAIRSLWSMRPMNTEEAKQFSISEDLADLFVKVETGKAQYARKRPHAWFVAEERELANGDPAHMLMPWSPPTITITPEMMTAALRALRQGLHGEPCSTSPTAQAAARLALEQAGVPRGACADVLKQLISTGEVAPRLWRDPSDRKMRKRLWTAGNAFTGWQDDAPDEALRH